MYDGPNQELLERYGTSAIYFENLEKRADTVFSEGMQGATAGEWGRLLTAPQEQADVDHQRLQAQMLNMRFRQLEAERMSDVREHFGGTGSMRQKYVRRMQYQPYMLHPMMAAMAMQGVGPGGGMEVTASARRCGAALAKVAYQNLPQSPGVAYDAGGMMPRGLVAPHLQEARAHAGRALGESSMAAGYGFGEGSLAAGQRVGNTAQGLGTGFGEASLRAGARIGGAAQRAGAAMRQAKERTPGLVRRAAGLPGAMFNSFGRGVERLMQHEVRPTVSWGTGIVPAANVNEYGISIGGGGY